MLPRLSQRGGLENAHERNEVAPRTLSAPGTIILLRNVPLHDLLLLSLLDRASVLAEKRDGARKLLIATFLGKSRDKLRVRLKIPWQRCPGLYVVRNHAEAR